MIPIQIEKVTKNGTVAGLNGLDLMLPSHLYT